MVNADSTLSKLREEEREVRRNLIIDAAMRLFAGKTFDQVGMRDIAAEAGISPASIYRYFADRDELLLEALLRETKAIEQGLRGISGENANSSVEQFADNFVDYLLEHGPFFQMMTHFMIGGGIRESALERLNDSVRKILDVFDEMFKNIGAEGNVRLISHAFFASLNGILITFWNYPGRDAEETRKHIHRVAGIIAKIFKKAVT